MPARKVAKCKMSLTQKRVADLPQPATGRTYTYDTRVVGLCVCVTDKGARTWYLVRKLLGKTVRIRVGTVAELTVDAARKQATLLLAEMIGGNDPRAARQSARHEQTLEELWASWLENYAKQRRKTWPEDVRTWRCFLAPWGKRRLSSIHKSDIQALHNRIALESGKYRANRVHELIRTMFNRARDIGFEGPNPAVGIKRFREERRDRFLHGDELPRFFQAVMEEPNTMLRDFFLLCLLTGARRGNVQSMAWADVNFDAAIWRIPMTKSGEPVVVPLSGPALAILADRSKARNGSPWVFPSTGRSGHLTEPKAAWKRICTRAGLTDVRIHDLRRSMGSWQAMTGASLPIIGKSLGHKLAETTMIYSRLQLNPVRASVELATTAMLTAGGLQLLKQNGSDDGALILDARPADSKHDAAAVSP
jgi:integrase